ncbi:MAG: glycoside hydrolase family 9 protein [Bacteroidia bacterium]|nr:glycoside hydrolase family 9 protein [Bacteroidia bacterium]
MRHSLLSFLLCCQIIAVYAQLPTPSPHIHIDQFGYLPDAEKVAVISDPQMGFNSNESFSPGNTYEVRSYPDQNLILSGTITSWNGGATHNQSGDKAWWFDFSSLNVPGEYYIYDPGNDVASFPFKIGEDVYTEVLKQAVRTFFYQRSGFAKQAPYTDAKWSDGASHLGTEQDLDCRLVSNPLASTSKDLSGGWYDAGDYNKYVNFTHTVVHNLLSAYEKNPDIWTDDFNIPESGNGIPDLLDEIKWELDWLLKMQEADGSGLMKVSVTDFAASSPPTSDNAFRRYGPAQASATLTLASNFAKASIIFGSLSDAGMQTYGDTLLARAVKAWNWIQNNPAASFYDNSGFQSANPEVSEYDQDATKFATAVYLFIKTGEAQYKSFVDANYADIHALQWNFWYPYENVYQDALLYYANNGSATPTVANAIKNNFINSASSGNAGLLPAYQNGSDPYRAYLADQDYVWGSNQVKSHTGVIMNNMVYYDLAANDDQKEDFKNGAAGYIHFMHGVNPMNLVFLSNMKDFGAENSINEIYHAWFGDGTVYDNAQTSSVGPVPGYLSGGPNPSYAPSQGYFSPPQDQPAQKSYLDWNTSWPQDSWQITEPAIYYQAAYIHLLSQYVEQSSSTLAVEYESFVAYERNAKVELRWKTTVETGSDFFQIERSIDGQMFERVGRVLAKGSNETYSFTDQSPPEGKLYYRLKEIEVDGNYSYSEVRTVFINASFGLKADPNPIRNFINIEVKIPNNASFSLELLDMQGRLIRKIEESSDSQSSYQYTIATDKLSLGVYFLKLESEGEILYKKLLKN